MSHTWDVLLWHNDSIVRFDQSEGRILLTWTNERREWPSLVCSLQPPSLQWSAGWWCNPWQWRKVRRTTLEVKKYSSTSCSSLFSSISGPSYIISRYKDIWCLRWNSGHHYISDEFQHALDNMKEKSIYTFLLKSWKLSLLYLQVPRKLYIYVKYLSF